MNAHQLVAALFLSLACGTTVHAADSVRIDATSGAPRITVDSAPVRARMFFGLPGSRPLNIGPEGKEISFEFSPIEDEPDRATMHLRFGQAAGDIDLDDIQVVDLSEQGDVIPLCNFEEPSSLEQNWMSWPLGDANTTADFQVAARAGRDGTHGLHITLQDPANGVWPDFHLFHRPNLRLKAGHRYRVSMWVRATPARLLTVAFYRPGEVYTFLGGPPSCFESQIKLAANVDVDFVSFPVHLPWPKPGETVDWSVVDRSCQTVLNANPRALLLPRIGMGAPAWWRAAHPDAVMVWDQGPQQYGDVAVASPDYLRDAGERLESLVEHLEQTFGQRMAGYHPCGQNTGEWFYQETWGPALNGYSEQSLHAWRRWLKGKYVENSKLADAWHDPTATLDSVTIPAPEARRAAPAGILRDPVSERPLIDFAEFQQEMMANCVCHFAGAVRRASQGKRLVVFFYGYVHEFGAIRLGPAVSGHYALRQVLNCPDIDVLCSPISYFDRGLGQSGPSMTAAESVALAGKMWLVEDDTRTYLAAGSTFPGWQDGVETSAETNQLLLRNTGQCALRNFATWWMDLGATGWFDDPSMWQQMDGLQGLDQAMLEMPRPFQPEVAVVVDQRSMLHVAAGGDDVTRPNVYEIRRPLGRLGTPYGQYLLDDVAAGKVHAKLYVFANPWCLSARQRQQILEATRGAVRIWCYAPGFHDGNHTSLTAMRELTGFQLQPISVPEALAHPTQTGRQVGLNMEIGLPKPIQPLFAATDAQPDETLAHYSDGQSAVAMRELDGGTSIFVGPPGISTELLRLAAIRARVHLFTDADCNVYANGPLLVLHASQDGPIQVDLRTDGPIRDMLTGQHVGVGPRLTLHLRKGETRLLRAD